MTDAAAIVPPRPRVLCVDDDERVLAALHRQLRGRYDVTVACGGAAGLECLRRDAPYALVVTDLHMPQMDGRAFLAAALVIAPHIVALLMSGGNEPPPSASDPVVFRRIAKPCPPDVLWASLDAALAYAAQQAPPAPLAPASRTGDPS